jgi:hypothetical protein
VDVLALVDGRLVVFRGGALGAAHEDVRSVGAPPQRHRELPPVNLPDGSPTHDADEDGAVAVVDAEQAGPVVRAHTLPRLPRARRDGGGDCEDAEKDGNPPHMHALCFAAM